MAVLFVALQSCAEGGSKSEEKVDEVAYHVIDLITSQQFKKLDKEFVHPDMGVLNYVKYGVVPDCYRSRTLESFKHLPEKNTRFHVVAGKSVSFDCDLEQWVSQGLFITEEFECTIKRTMEHRIKFDEGDFTEKDLSDAEFLAKNSFKVVATDIDLVFYLTPMDGRWYLTCIDQTEYDCSA